ncbi:hypothetical protein C2S52_007082 [Perilla frutescens var. hirtella]|nr:hypothetical protein C2S52_007082 [Perilla frutescens var. hirtella]
MRARFKALSGQRSDWDALYCFWRDLIIKTARHLGVFVIRPSRVTGLWFRRRPDGLSPLCLDRVLLEMHRAGDLQTTSSSSHSQSRLPHFLRRALDFLAADDRPLSLTADYYILAPLLEERTLEVVERLSQNHWNSSCVVTMEKFEGICCVGSSSKAEEALAILDYLSARGRATRLLINKPPHPHPIEGVKVCLALGAASTASTSDYTTLHLTWTADKLEKQLHLIDQRYHKSRKSALASLKDGNKKVALRYAKELKLASQSRERCSALLDQVERVLQAITDAESSKKVVEALQSSKRAMQENQISIEEVELCLEELDENIDALKRLDNALEATTAYGEIDDDDMEEEFDALQMEINSKKNQVPPKIAEETDALSNAMSNLHIEEEEETEAGLMNDAMRRLVALTLKSLVKKPNLEEGRRLHALLLTRGHGHDTDSLLDLVQVYAGSGSLHEAMLVFSKLRPSSAHSHHSIAFACNAILRAHLDSCLFSEALNLFTHLVSMLAFVPDNYTCPLVLKACRSLEEVRKVHGLIRFAELHRCFKPNVYTKCALIDMFAKCGSLDDARHVFDEMPLKERDLPSWTAMICGTVHQGQELQALRLFSMMMRVGGLHPDSALMAAILPACGRLEARQMGMALQASALKSGFHDDLFVSNATIDMYCKLRDTQQAHTIFCSMHYRDDVSWRTLIAGYSQNSQYTRSLELYAEMISWGVIPSGMVVASILPALGKLNLSQEGKVMHGFILKRGFDSDVVVGSALIDMYSLCGLTGETEVLLSIWSDWDLMIWNSAISGNASVENYGMALAIFRKMWESKFIPNSITLMSILPICTKMGAHKQGLEIHCHAIRNGLDTVVSVCNSIIDMYCKCGYLWHGLKVFDKMVAKDIISYNTLISSYGFHGYAKQALVLFDEIKSLAMKPTKATFVGLLSACSHAGLVDEGQTLYRSMIVDYGIRPNTEHYSCMVDLLGRAGHINDACSFIRAMPEEPDANVLGCLLSACRLHNVMQNVDFLDVEDKFHDSGYHILISNMYASTKRWKDASRVRALIKERGLRKKPGNSWIQIGHRTHVFDARDTTHSEFEKIQEILKILLSEMKDRYLQVDLSLPLSSL